MTGKQRIKVSLFILFAFFLPALAFAQADEPVKDEEYIIDSLPQPPPEVDIDDEETETEPAGSKFFRAKDLQANGGGPDSIQPRPVPDTAMATLKNDNAFWYVDHVFDNEKQSGDRPKRRTPFTETPLFQTLLWVAIIGGFAAFIIIYLSNSNVSLFRRQNRMITTDQEMEAELDNIFEINYGREIDKAIERGNYRLGVRLLFLQLLKNLADRNIIQYRPDRTNFDYLVQLHTTRHYQDFFRLTRNYEYSWYGHFDIDLQKFSVIRQDFESFDNKLK